MHPARGSMNSVISGSVHCVVRGWFAAERAAIRATTRSDFSSFRLCVTQSAGAAPVQGDDARGTMREERCDDCRPDR